MKKQIRLNVFETNSSTQHALVIKSNNRQRKFEDGIPEGFTLPEKVALYKLEWGQMDELKLTTIENRLVWMYNLALAKANYGDLNTLIRFFVCLQKLGIKYELFEFDDVYGYYSEVPDEFIEEILGDEEKFIAFLFSYDIFYDTYADDCGSWEQQCEWEDTIAKFAKGSDTINLWARC